MNSSCYPTHHDDAPEPTTSTFQTPFWNAEKISNGTRLTVQLPGVAKSDIQLHIDTHILSLIAQRSDNVDQTWKPLQNETRPSSYQLKLHVTQPFVQENIKATLENGLLSLTLPLPAEPEPVTILVN